MKSINKLLDKKLYIDIEQIAISSIETKVFKTFNVDNIKYSLSRNLDTESSAMYIINIYTFNNIINFLYKNSNYMTINIHEKNYLSFKAKEDMLESILITPLISTESECDYKYKDLHYNYDNKCASNNYAYPTKYIKSFINTLGKRKNIEYLHIILSRSGLLCLVCDDEILIVAPRINDNEMW
jgi:hypothetical protein